MNTERFCELHNVTMEAEQVDKNPNMEKNPDSMPAGSNHWKVTLAFDGRTMETYFSMGPALDHEPEAVEVLDCLASDASSFENARSFEEWARDFGYDEDSRKAERIYHTVERQSRELKELLGPELYDALLNAERL